MTPSEIMDLMVQVSPATDFEASFRCGGVEWKYAPIGTFRSPSGFYVIWSPHRGLYAAALVARTAMGKKMIQRPWIASNMHSWEEAVAACVAYSKTPGAPSLTEKPS